MSATELPEKIFYMTEKGCDLLSIIPGLAAMNRALRDGREWFDMVDWVAPPAKYRTKIIATTEAELAKIRATEYCECTLKDVRNLPEAERTQENIVEFLATAANSLSAEVRPHFIEKVCNAIYAENLLYTSPPPPPLPIQETLGAIRARPAAERTFEAIVEYVADVGSELKESADRKEEFITAVCGALFAENLVYTPPPLPVSPPDATPHASPHASPPASPLLAAIPLPPPTPSRLPRDIQPSARPIKLRPAVSQSSFRLVEGIVKQRSTPAVVVKARPATAWNTERTEVLKRRLAECKHWYYVDMDQLVQGPFTSEDMQAWHKEGQLPSELLVRSGLLGQFTPLAKYFQSAPCLF